MSGACEHLVEQLTPDTTWGTSFLTARLATRKAGDTFRFVARDPGSTLVTVIDGSSTTSFSLTAAIPDHQMIISNDAQITSSKPIAVAQLANGGLWDGTQGDPSMMMIPPRNQYQAGYTVTTMSPRIPSNYINLVVPTIATSAVRVDGLPVGSSFAPIGASGFSATRVPVSMGSHTVTGNGQPMGAFVYGFHDYEAYSYPAGITFEPITTPVAGLDHFKCYAVRSGKSATRSVKLGDQFGVKSAHVHEARQLCNPVRKAHAQKITPISHLQAHLVCHETVDVSKMTGLPSVRLRNQFGTVETKITGAQSLCLPSLKRVVEGESRAPHGALPERALDHFRCYGVQPRKVVRTVGLRDQFGKGSSTTARLVRLCTPVRKTYEAKVTRIRRPDAHLACYTITPHLVPEQRDVVVRNQFGRKRLRVQEARTLCLPTSKEILPKVVGPVARPVPLDPPRGTLRSSPRLRAWMTVAASCIPCAARRTRRSRRAQ